MGNRRHWISAASAILLGLVAIAAQPPVLHAAEPGSPARLPDLDLAIPPALDPENGRPIDPAVPSDSGKEEGPPPASTPNKQDRADVLDGEAPLTDQAMRAEALNELYDKLQEARDAAAAAPITAEIEEAWRNSGSDTVNLLMSRADDFVLASDPDLALQVLDAVTAIAPDDAEGWHQRALVESMKNNYAGALADLLRALTIDPNHYKANRDLGVVLRQTGDNKGALAAFRRALKINPFFEQARQAADELAHELEGQNI
jgi:tetratricopeptide (TPR) repeat protein